MLRIALEISRRSSGVVKLPLFGSTGKITPPKSKTMEVGIDVFMYCLVGDPPSREATVDETRLRLVATADKETDIRRKVGERGVEPP